MKRFQWEERTLKRSLSKLKDGTHFSPQSKTGPFKYITSKNIKFGYLDLSNVVYISEYEHKKIFQSSPVHYGDILFTKDGANTGNTAINILKEEFSVLSSVAILSGKKDILDNNFLFQLLLSPMAQRKIKSEMAGQAITRLTLSQIGAFAFTFPSLSEQQKIARILTTWDAAITCAQELLENSKQQKKALMQQMLTGRRRLPGFNTAWTKSMIRELSKRVTRKSDGKVHPILTISSTSGFVRQDSKYRRYMAGESVNNYILLYKGEFAYNKGNSKTYEFGCIFPLNNFETGLVPHVYVCFKIHSKYCAEFYKYLFENDYLKKQLGDMVNTGVRNNGLLNIKPEEFLCATLPVPPLDEQKAIAEVLTAADALIAQYEARLAHLQMQKKALMQQLLTGKIRVTPDTPDTSGDASATPA